MAATVSERRTALVLRSHSNAPWLLASSAKRSRASPRWRAASAVSRSSSRADSAAVMRSKTVPSSRISPESRPRSMRAPRSPAPTRSATRASRANGRSTKRRAPTSPASSAIKAPAPRPRMLRTDAARRSVNACSRSRPTMAVWPASAGLGGTAPNKRDRPSGPVSSRTSDRGRCIACSSSGEAGWPIQGADTGDPSCAAAITTPLGSTINTSAPSGADWVASCPASQSWSMLAATTRFAVPPPLAATGIAKCRLCRAVSKPVIRSPPEKRPDSIARRK